jgi:hypothetical protein
MEVFAQFVLNEGKRGSLDLTMLKPSTGRVVESQTLFRLELVGKGALCPAPMNPPEGGTSPQRK